MKKLVLIMLLSIASISYAQEFRLNITVCDKLTQRPIPSIHTLFKVEEDSSLTYLQQGSGNGRFLLILPSKPMPGKYRLEVVGAKSVEVKTAANELYWKYEPTEEYESQVVALSVPDDAASPYTLPAIYMERRRSKQLKEVTATATKIMFYNKGDTLIYNADAFVLAEGSLLDDLLAQMPGVELTKSGEIKVNGRRIDRLLLNGKDLFNNKKQLMLENLAAYTIKDIAIYKQRTRLAELLDFDTGREINVMNVRLKREYAQGAILNVDAGYGSHNRYLGRLFGMLFSENVSLSTYASANNLSDDSRPEKDDKSWSVPGAENGVYSKHQAGLTYLAQGRANLWEAKGSVEANYNDRDFSSSISAENYGLSSNIYQYAWNSMRNKTLKLNTNHHFYTKLGQVANLEIEPQFSYVRSRQDLSTVSASFDVEADSITRSRILALYSGEDTLCEHLINRLFDEQRSDDKTLSASLKLSSDIKLSGGRNPSAITVTAAADYYERNNDYTSRYLLSYDRQQSLTAHNRYFRLHPDFDLRGYAEVSFQQFLQKWSISLPLTYQFKYDRKKRMSDVFQLSADSDVDFTGSLNAQPDGDYASGFIPGLSYNYLAETFTHAIEFNPQHQVPIGIARKYFVMLFPSIRIEFANRKLYYHRNGSVQLIARNDIMPQIGLHTCFGAYKSRAWQYNLGVKMESRAVDLMSLIEQPDTDPLKVFDGNPNLKNSTKYAIHLFADKRPGGQKLHKYGLDFSAVHNDIAMFYVIIPETGRYIFSSHNVNGNMDGSAYYSFFTPFGRSSNLFTLSTETSVTYRRRLDLESTVLNDIAAKESLKLTWDFYKGCRAGAFADTQFDHYKYSHSGQSSFNAWTCRYGVDATVSLPWNWSISTDLTFYTRRGFLDDRLNKTDLIWNARISKSILKGSLVFIADGFDMLRQISNVTYTVSSQVRTETVSNTMPSYFLFHIQYRFNKQPKQK